MACMMTRITGIGCTMTDEQVAQFQRDLRSDLDVSEDDDEVTLERDGDNLSGYAYNDGGWREEQWHTIIQEFCDSLVGYCKGGVSSVSRDMDSGGDDHTVIDAIAGCEALNSQSSDVLNRDIAQGLAREAALLVRSASRHNRDGFKEALEKALADVFLAELNTGDAPWPSAS